MINFKSIGVTFGQEYPYLVVYFVQYWWSVWVFCSSTHCFMKKHSRDCIFTDDCQINRLVLPAVPLPLNFWKCPHSQYRDTDGDSSLTDKEALWKVAITVQKTTPYRKKQKDWISMWSHGTTCVKFRVKTCQKKPARNSTWTPPKLKPNHLFLFSSSHLSVSHDKEAGVMDRSPVCHSRHRYRFRHFQGLLKQ